MNRKELQHVRKEVEEELRTLRGGEQLSAKFARHCRDLLEHIKEMEQRNGVFVSHGEVGFLKVLHEHGSVALLQSRSLVRQPLFRDGALMQVEELSPTLEWARVLIQQLVRTEVPSGKEEDTRTDAEV